MNSTWEHSHTGVFTRDFARTLQYYKSLGLAPETSPRPRRPPSEKVITIEFDQVVEPASPDPSQPFLELLYIGDLELEVLHAPAERPEGEALAYAEGVNHVCFNVADIDGETDRLVRKGLRVIQDARLNGVRIEDYLDTRRHGNMLLSFRPPQTAEAKARKAAYPIIKWRYLGVGAVVNDLEKTAAYYQSMDIATFGPQATLDTGGIKDLRLYGKPSQAVIRARTQLMQIGPVAYELIEPVSGDAVFRESLDRRGEGIINLAFAVDDLAAETARLTGTGVSVIFSGRSQAGAGLAGGRAFAYLDTRRDGGDVMMKLLQS